MLAHFQGTPRAPQVHALTELGRAWHLFDLHVIVAPTGTGKTGIANAIVNWGAEWDRVVTYIVPDGELQAQVERDYPSLPSLRGAGEYRCVTGGTCLKRTKKLKACTGNCPHAKAIAAAKPGGRLVHLHTYLGTAPKRVNSIGYPHVAIFDEAHKLRSFLESHVELRLWWHQHQWPKDVRDAEGVVAWIDSRPPHFQRARAKAMLCNPAYETVIHKTWEEYKGDLKLCLHLRPLTVAHCPPILWPPRKVSKLVMLSATIGPKDIEEIAPHHSVNYIHCDSPIPYSRRPVIYLPAMRMVHQSRATNIPAAALLMQQLATHHANENGFVHTTYNEALEYRKFLTDSRWMWHTHETKNSQYEDWRTGAAGQGRVFVGSGLTEGIDLAGNIARWQVLTKVPRLNVMDPWVRARTLADPSWYAWQSVKALMQACGRVCRGPEDYGVTYIFDTMFAELFNNYRYMFPDWFAKSIIWNDKLCQHLNTPVTTVLPSGTTSER